MNIDQLESRDFFGGTQVVPCTRCAAPCRIGAPRNPDARLMALATEETVKAGRGLCANCAATEFLKVVCEADALFALSDYGKQHGAQALLLPHVQKQFVAIMQSGHADARPGELNWPWIVEHWDLPLPKAKKSKKR